MAVPAADIRIVYRLVNQLAPGFDLDLFFEERFGYKHGINNILAGVVPQIIRKRAGITKSDFPLALILLACQRAAFFKIAAAIVIRVKKFAIAAVGKDHDFCLIDAGDVFASAGIHTDDISSVDKGRHLNF